MYETWVLLGTMEMMTPSMKRMYLGCFGEAFLARFYSNYLRFETSRQLAQGPRRL